MNSVAIESFAVTNRSLLLYWQICVVGVTSAFLARLSILEPWE
jgi:hypothetical protein